MKAVILVATSCLSSIAAANPAWTAEVGGQIAGSSGVAGVGGTVGAGQRLIHSGMGSIWTHETFTATSMFGPLLFGHGEGALYRGTAGVELQAATSPRGNSYFLLGLEGGYEHLDYEGVDQTFFGPSTSVSHHEHGPIGMIRLGIRVGGDTVGFEPVVELVPRSGNSTGGQFGSSLVFAW